MLIDKGADVNVRGNDNNTPYSLAKKAKNHELAILLKNRGAVIKDSEGAR